MNFTSKSRYALKIMMDLAIHSGPSPIHRRDIAARQGIPTDYLDQIMIRLRKADLVSSVRGRGGGYRLGRSAENICLLEVFTAAEGSLEPVQCLTDEKACGFDAACISHGAWREIFSALCEPLEMMSLADITRDHVKQHHLCPGGGIRECKGVVTQFPRLLSGGVAVD